MLGRLGPGVALASIAALVLVGCSPGEPTEEVTLTQIEATLSGFHQTVSDQMSAEQVSSAALEQYATPELAQTWAQDLRDILGSGYSSTGVPTIINIDLTEASDTSVLARVCTDGSNVVTIGPDDRTVPPTEPVAWEAEFVPAPSEPTLLLAALEPIPDDTACTG